MNRAVFVAHLVISTLMLTGGEARSQTASQVPTAGLSTTENIQEAVFRYQLLHFRPFARCVNKLFFIGEGPFPCHDPAAGIIGSLASTGYTVNGITGCTQSTAGVFDRKTKVRGVAFLIDDTKITSVDSAKVDAVVFDAGKSGFGALYTVIRDHGGEWRVARCDIGDLFETYHKWRRSPRVVRHISAFSGIFRDSENAIIANTIRRR